MDKKIPTWILVVVLVVAAALLVWWILMQKQEAASIANRSSENVSSNVPQNEYAQELDGLNEAEVSAEFQQVDADLQTL